MGELSAQVGLSEFPNCKNWYENENENVCGTRSRHRLARFSYQVLQLENSEIHVALPTVTPTKPVAACRAWPPVRLPLRACWLGRSQVGATLCHGVDVTRGTHRGRVLRVVCSCRHHWGVGGGGARAGRD